jgi:hypothetical protein
MAASCTRRYQLSSLSSVAKLNATAQEASHLTSGDLHMFGVLGHLGAAIVAIPVAVVTACFVLVVIAALAARRPATRRHYLTIMDRLTTYVVALRSRR